MGKTRVEIIDIKLPINMAEEIKKRTDVINEDIKIHTKGLIEKAKLKKQESKSKKKRLEEFWDAKMKSLLQKFEEAYKDPNLWINGNQVLNIIDVDSVSLSAVIMRFKAFLRKNTLWALDKKRVKQMPLYRLQRYG